MVDFKISESQTTVELKATGELLGPDTALFKSHLVTLLQHGKSKIYKIDLSSVAAIDNLSIELLLVLRRELYFLNTPLTLQLPAEPSVRGRLTKMGL